MNTQLSDRYLNYFRYAAEVNEKLDAFCVLFDGKDTIMDDCTVRWTNADGEVITPDQFQNRSTEWLPGTQNTPFFVLKVHFKNGPAALPEASISLTVCRDHFTCEAAAVDGWTSVFTGKLCWGSDPEHSTFAISADRPGYGLRGGCGPTVSRWDDALFDRADGSLLQLDKDESLRLGWCWDCKHYTFTAIDKFGVQVFPHYFEDRFCVPYRPLCKTQYPTPPAGWMTWYAVKFDACEQAVLENTKLQKELLADYGADTVWVDWEWYHNAYGDGRNADFKPGLNVFSPNPEAYPNGLKYVAEEIEKNGFIPALWMAPTHEPTENDYVNENPDIVLYDKPHWCGRYFLDMTHPKFLQDYLPRAVKQISEWGYKAMKWDVLPLTCMYTSRNHDKLYDPSKSTTQAMRNAARTVREILGEEFYMLSCCGGGEYTTLLASDIFDAARIGADIFTWEELKTSFVQRILRLYPFHNTQLYCDPDNVVLRPEYNDLYQAQTRITLVSLLGLPCTFGDDLRELPMERVELLRRGLPTLDIHPMDMRELTLDRDELITNLVINRPFECWNVAAVTNLAQEERTITVDFGKDLGLEDGEYLVHEYWTDTFHGVVSDKLTLTLPACATAVLSVRKKTGNLQLVSTSRHITQGAAELLDVQYADGKLSGRSKVVRDDPYTIKAYDPGSERLVEKTLLPTATGELEWTLNP
ncbi:MAG: alpha-galactosidase [Oscillospiraceae bacterium]|nr:alpha-galactosidase [Oscillospiraceae bacterium]